MRYKVHAGGRLLMLLLPLLLAGCLAQPASREELLQRIEARSQLPDSHYNLLWYQGSRGDTHYFKHIRGYFLDEARFRVAQSELPIAQSRPYSWDSDRWMQVERIGEHWHSARRDAQQQWQAQACTAHTWPCLRVD